jgi:hypothetical protein
MNARTRGHRIAFAASFAPAVPPVRRDAEVGRYGSAPPRRWPAFSK